MRFFILIYQDEHIKSHRLIRFRMPSKNYGDKLNYCDVKDVETKKTVKNCKD